MTKYSKKGKGKEKEKNKKVRKQTRKVKQIKGGSDYYNADSTSGEGPGQGYEQPQPVSETVYEEINQSEVTGTVNPPVLPTPN